MKNLLPFVLAIILNVVETKYSKNKVTVKDNPQYNPPILNEIGIDMRIRARYDVPLMIRNPRFKLDSIVDILAGKYVYGDVFLTYLLK